MAQANDPTKPTPVEAMRKNRQAMINTWLRNLTPETALQIMGHVLLGQAIAERPDLNEKNRYVQFKDDENFDPDKVATFSDRIYITSLRDVSSEETMKKVVELIQLKLGNALKGVDPIIARSMRMFVTYEGTTASSDVVYTLVWMTYKKDACQQLPKT